MKRGGAMGVLSAMLVLAAMLMRPAGAEIYLVRMTAAPVITYAGTVPGLKATAVSNGMRPDISSTVAQSYIRFLTNEQDSLLVKTLGAGTYKKLYTLHYLINGFVVQTSPAQAASLAAAPGVVQVEKDWKVEKLTTHTPDFLGLPTGVWPQVGGVANAGEGIVIGVVDTGIYPSHPSFATDSEHPYDSIPTYTGICEVAPEFPEGSCNGKIIGARHFAAAAVAGGDFNATRDFASPFDADGHGSHTAATAAGNHGVPVTVKGYDYGTASGMAPRARIAVYKALYPFGGYISDVVAAVDQAVQDGVDIISLSLGPTSAPTGVSTFLNVFDVELLFAVKAGVFVAQAAGNSGPAQTSILSFSPWIVSVAASNTDRTYTNTLVLGNNYKVSGVGLSPPTASGGSPIRIVSATDAFSGNISFVNPNECQQVGAFKRSVVQGSILMCIYSFSFEFGSASIKEVATTAKALGAAGFLLVSDPKLGATSRADPSPLILPGLVVTDINSSLTILRYYNESTKRDATGAVTLFGAHASIGDGRVASFGVEAPVVATFSSRGPDILNSQSQFADVMKPDLMAPGYLIWSAWSPSGVDAGDFFGEKFAMLSGTSMATPHLAGVAALVKQAHPLWTPSVIASALMTSANVYDGDGNAILAQNPSSNFSSPLGPGTPFDFGAGSVNPTAALDPGLVFEADFDNYVSFLCVVPGVDPASVHDATGAACASPALWASDLNKPYITIANLVGSRTVTRMVTNMASTTETYKVSIARQLPGVLVTVTPESFIIKQGETASLVFTFRATTSTTNVFSFGTVELTGSEDHYVHIPLAVSPNSAVS